MLLLLLLQGLIVLLGVAVVSATPVDYSAEYAAPQLLHAPLAAKIVLPEPVVSYCWLLQSHWWFINFTHLRHEKTNKNFFISPNQLHTKLDLCLYRNFAESPVFFFYYAPDDIITICGLFVSGSKNLYNYSRALMWCGFHSIRIASRIFTVNRQKGNAVFFLIPTLQSKESALLSIFTPHRIPARNFVLILTG